MGRRSSNDGVYMSWYSFKNIVCDFFRFFIIAHILLFGAVFIGIGFAFLAKLAISLGAHEGVVGFVGVISCFSTIAGIITSIVENT